MDLPRLEVAIHLAAALVAGAAIGIERSFHGRPAGFRTHALVCLASSLLMLVTLYQARWFPASDEIVRLDPTRMAQGIMTGIGFLGAGVIFKEGLTVRGLTTAASIWITAAIGVLLGVGMYEPAGFATLLTLGVLSVFRWVEEKLPTWRYAHHRVRFSRERFVPERELRDLLSASGFSVSGLSWHLAEGATSIEYRMTIRTLDGRNFGRLAAALSTHEGVLEYHVTPTGA